MHVYSIIKKPAKVTETKILYSLQQDVHILL